MTDRIDQQLGNYQLIQVLGQGHWAAVYLAEHRHLRTQAAIKVLHGPWADSEMEGFLREARTLARLRHPHIVRVLDFGVQEGTPFLVMEYAPSGTLRKLHPKDWETKRYNVLLGHTALHEAVEKGEPAEKLIRRSGEGVAEFAAVRKKYLLY